MGNTNLLRTASLLPLLATPALAQNPLFEFYGAAFEQLGRVIHDVGDRDGDGLSEIGLSYRSSGGPRVRVFRGSDGSQLSLILGRPVGDLNGDGLDDRFGSTPTEIGFRVYASDTGPLLWAVDIDPSNTYTYATVDLFDLGDVNGDGKDDLLASEALYNPGTVFQTSVYSGADGALIYRNQPQPGNVFPHAVPIGDVDGDQLTELAEVEWPLLRIRTAQGVELSARPLPAQVASLNYAFLFAGGHEGADADGDGVPDLGFSPFGTTNPPDATTSVLSGATGQVLLAVEGAGSSLGGDFDADGKADLLLWNDAALQVHSVASGSLLRRVQPVTPGISWQPSSESLGRNVVPVFAAPIGDLDGDGLDDLIVGEDYFTSSTLEPGRARVFTADWSDETGTRLAPPAATCPCGPAVAGGGCPNGVGSGASLVALGSTSLSDRHLSFSATELPPFESAILFAGTGPLANPTPFGAGVRLLGGPYRRVASHLQPFSGSALAPLGDTHTWRAGPIFGPYQPFGFNQTWTAGQTYYFQGWYTDSSGGAPCTQGFNLTNAVQFTITP